MRKDQHRIARHAATLLLVLASLTLAPEAWAQVRSSIGASARVLEAGPAWAAQRGLGTLLESAKDVDALTERADESVILTESDGSVGPLPRVTLVVQREPSAGDPELWDRSVEARPPGAAPQEGSRAAVSPRGGNASANASSSWRHVVVRVEHIAN